jgi:hypothetical protein
MTQRHNAPSHVSPLAFDLRPRVEPLNDKPKRIQLTSQTHNVETIPSSPAEHRATQQSAVRTSCRQMPTDGSQHKQLNTANIQK